MQNFGIISISDPKSPISEAYRTLRTNIEFSSLDNKVQVIEVTSSGPSEGKSTTAANLAVAMAKAGKRTIIIDSDLRKPNLHRLFKCSNHKGLSNLLIGETKFDEIAYKTETENLYILTSGTKPPNPAELLSSAKMQRFILGLRDNFDCIIIDTPPIIAVTDAQVVSKYTDGYILVVASGQAERQAVIKAKDLLDKVNAKPLGVVINKIEASKRNGYGYGYYYSYYDSEGHKEKKKVKAKEN